MKKEELAHMGKQAANSIKVMSYFKELQGMDDIELRKTIMEISLEFEKVLGTMIKQKRKEK